MAVRTEGEHRFIAVADAKRARYLFPEDGFAIWVPRGGMATFVPILALNRDGPADSIRADPERIANALRYGGAKRLPDGLIAGRKCLGLTYLSDAGKPAGTSWYDLAYGLLLAHRWDTGEGEFAFRATSVKIDAGLRDTDFRLDIPPSAPVFKGELDFIDAFVIRSLLRGTPPAAGAPGGPSGPELQRPAMILEATSAPPDFLGPFSESSASGWGATMSDYSWMFSQKWFSKSGGVIVFSQSSGNAYDLGPSRPGRKTTATVRGVPAAIVAYDRPFPGAIVTWQAGPTRYRLEGTAVTDADLVKMADAMREATVPPKAP